MSRLAQLLIVSTALFSTTLGAVELSDLSGVWERYDDGQLVERITAKTYLERQFLASHIEYFNRGSMVAVGSSAMTQSEQGLTALLHFSSGMSMQFRQIQHAGDGIAFAMHSLQNDGEVVGYSLFELAQDERQTQLVQTVFADKDLTQLMQQGYFLRIGK